MKYLFKTYGHQLGPLSNTVWNASRNLWISLGILVKYLSELMDILQDPCEIHFAILFKILL